MLNISIHKRNIYKKYFEKTGIQLTEEPIPSDYAGIQDTLEEMYYLAHDKPTIAIPKLRELVKEYPQIPSLKNYLSVAYLNVGNREASDRVVQDTLEQHPNYLFGITTKISRIHEKEELQKYKHLLGTPRTILSLIVVNRPVHISEFVYYQLASTSIYWC